MAADTREASTGPGNAQDPPSLATPLLATTERRYHGKIYETFTPPPSSSSPASQERTISPPENANAIPGGTTNTAGGRVKEVTFWDGIKSINMNDVKSLHQIPCVRDAMLVGIGSGFLLGGGRMVFGGMLALHAMLGELYDRLHEPFRSLALIPHHSNDVEIHVLGGGHLLHLICGNV